MLVSPETPTQAVARQTVRIHLRKTPTVADRVRIERDESRYPCKWTWPQFRCRVGTVVEVNRDRKRPHLTDWGVSFPNVTRRTDGRGANTGVVTKFKAHEIVRVAPESHAAGVDGIAGGCLPDTAPQRAAGCPGADRP
jgi:hypothetical protein